MKRLILFCAALALCSGCSVISYDRVFPKLGWYWSWEAKAQRAERSPAPARTNQAPVNP